MIHVDDKWDFVPFTLTSLNCTICSVYDMKVIRDVGGVTFFLYVASDTGR